MQNFRKLFSSFTVTDVDSLSKFPCWTFQCQSRPSETLHKLCSAAQSLCCSCVMSSFKDYHTKLNSQILHSLLYVPFVVKMHVFACHVSNNKAAHILISEKNCNTFLNGHMVFLEKRYFSGLISPCVHFLLHNFRDRDLKDMSNFLWGCIFSLRYPELNLSSKGYSGYLNWILQRLINKTD